MKVEGLPEMHVNPYSDMVMIEFRSEKGVVPIIGERHGESAEMVLKGVERITYNVIGEGRHVTLTDDFLESAYARVVGETVVLGDLEILLTACNRRYQYYFGTIISPARAGTFVVPI